MFARRSLNLVLNLATLFEKPSRNHHLSRNRARAIELDTMPPGAALDADAQDLLQRWFDGGTPE